MACRNQRQFFKPQSFPMNGFPGEERSVEVTARVAVAAGSPVVRTRSGGFVVFPLRETVHFTCGEEGAMRFCSIEQLWDGGGNGWNAAAHTSTAGEEEVSWSFSWVLF